MRADLELNDPVLCRYPSNAYANANNILSHCYVT
jgi:hypothetical protein